MDEEEIRARLDELVSEYVTVVYADGEFGVSWSSRAALREATALAEKLEQERDNGHS
jgi:hypothetical protein